MRSGSRSTSEVGSNLGDRNQVFTRQVLFRIGNAIWIAIHLCSGIKFRESQSSVYAASFIQDRACDLDRDPPLQWDRHLGNRNQVFTRQVLFRIGNAIRIAIHL